MKSETEPKAIAKRSKSVLDGLKMVEQPDKVYGYDPIRTRRQKLASALLDQLNLLEAVLHGEAYTKTVNRRRRDLETDEVFHVEQHRRVVPWWMVDDEGLVRFALRHGSAKLMVREGKNVLVLSSLEELKAILPTLRQEVLAGRFDDALAAAASMIFGRFKGDAPREAEET